LSRSGQFEHGLKLTQKWSRRELCYKLTERPWPAFRFPEKLIDDIRAIRKFSRGPIFLILDPRMGGLERAQKFFSLLQKEDTRRAGAGVWTGDGLVQNRNAGPAM